MQSQKRQNDLCLFLRHINITVIQVYVLTSNAEEPEVERFYEDLQDLLEGHQKRCPLWDWNAKVGSQEIPEVTGKFGLEVQNKAGQRLTEFSKRMHWSRQTPSSNNTREDSTHDYHQMVNTEMRLIIFFTNMEKLYTVSKNKTRG